MSYTERRSIFGLLYTIGFVIGFYQFMVTQGLNQFSLQDWGIWYLIFFGSLVIGRVVFTVVHVVIEAIVIAIKTKDEARINAEIQDDERTKMIDLKSTVHIGTFLIIGFVGGLLILAFGGSIQNFFLAMYVGVALAGISYDGLAIFYHRMRG